MINNWEHKNLKPDYSSMYHGNNHPSDIDLFYLANDDTLILGEIKNQSYKKEAWEKQKKLFARLIDNYKNEAMYLFITHNKYVQNGDTVIDIPNCYIKEYYYKGEWRIPQRKTKVWEVLKKYGLIPRTSTKDKTIRE